MPKLDLSDILITVLALGIVAYAGKQFGFFEL